MPSRSLGRWTTEGHAALDEIEAAHRAVGGGAPGRRYATEQINQAYAVLLSSRFQAFCRDLHTEAADCLVSPAIGGPPLNSQALRDIVHGRLIDGRKLDSGNPNLGNLGSDFGRFGFNFASEMRGIPVKASIESSLVQLGHLNLWRNAIAHQDFSGQEFTKAFPGSPSLRLADVKRWRAHCVRLAVRMDEVVGRQLSVLLGRPPW